MAEISYKEIVNLIEGQNLSAKEAISQIPQLVNSIQLKGNKISFVGLDDERKKLLDQEIKKNAYDYDKRDARDLEESLSNDRNDGYGSYDSMTDTPYDQYNQQDGARNQFQEKRPDLDTMKIYNKDVYGSSAELPLEEQIELFARIHDKVEIERFSDELKKEITDLRQSVLKSEKKLRGIKDKNSEDYMVEKASLLDGQNRLKLNTKRLQEENDRLEHPDIRRIRTLGKRALDKIVASNLGITLKVAKGFQHSAGDIQDLIQEGNLGLIEAAKSFNPNKYKDMTRNTFGNIAVSYVKSSMLQYLTREDKGNQIPLRLQKQMEWYRKAEASLMQKLGRMPNDKELQKEINRECNIELAKRLWGKDGLQKRLLQQDTETVAIDILKGSQTAEPSKEHIVAVSEEINAYKVLEDKNQSYTAKNQAWAKLRKSAEEKMISPEKMAMGIRFYLEKNMIKQAAAEISAIKALQNPMISENTRKEAIHVLEKGSRDFNIQPEEMIREIRTRMDQQSSTLRQNLKEVYADTRKQDLEQLKITRQQKNTESLDKTIDGDEKMTIMRRLADPNEKTPEEKLVDKQENEIRKQMGKMVIEAMSEMPYDQQNIIKLSTGLEDNHKWSAAMIASQFLQKPIKELTTKEVQEFEKRQNESMYQFTKNMQKKIRESNLDLGEEERAALKMQVQKYEKNIRPVRRSQGMER